MAETVSYPRFRWFSLLTLCVLTVATSVIMISPAPLIGIIAKSLQLGLGPTTGALMGLFNLALAAACIVGGFLCDRFGLVRVYTWSSVLMIVPTLALPYCGDSLGAAVAVRIIQAFGAGPILASVAAVAALWFPPLERGIVTGIQGMAVTLGIAIGFVAGPVAYAAVGRWQTAIAWQTISCFLVWLSRLSLPWVQSLPLRRKRRYVPQPLLTTATSSWPCGRASVGSASLSFFVSVGVSAPSTT